MRFSITSCLVVAALISACSEDLESPSPLAPEEANLSQVAAQPLGSLTSEYLGPPRDFDVTLEVAVAAEPAPYELSDEALIEAVSASDGRVVIGFKNPSQQPRRTRARLVDGVLRATVGPIASTVISEGRGFMEALGVVIEQPYRNLPMIGARVEPTLAPKIRRHPHVDYIEPRLVAVAQGVATVAAPTENLSTISAPAVWPSATGTGIPVTMIDTGLEGGQNPHSALPLMGPPGGSYWACYDFYSRDPDPGNGDCTDVPNFRLGPSHGTGTSGVLMATDFIHGVAPDIPFFGMLRICISETECDLTDMGNALTHAANNNTPEVVVVTFNKNTFSSSVADGAALAVQRGDLLFASAGNGEFGGPVLFPATLPEFHAVSGTLSTALHPNSRSGPEIEFSAPFEVTTLQGTSGSGSAEGTSYATPAVAGVAALCWSMQPHWSAGDVLERLRVSVDDLGPSGRDNQFGYGRINALKAVQECANDPVIPDINGPSQVEPFAVETWTSSVDGGVPPYSYAWSGVLSGNDASVSGWVASSGWLYLEVTDSNGKVGTDQLFITVSSF